MIGHNTFMGPQPCSLAGVSAFRGSQSVFGVCGPCGGSARAKCTLQKPAKECAPLPCDPIPKYEERTLSGFIGTITDGVATTTTAHTIRVVDGLAIGTAPSTDPALGGLETGYIANLAVSSCAQRVGVTSPCSCLYVPTLALRQLLPSGQTYALNLPRALTTRRFTDAAPLVIIVGTGTVYDTDGVTPLQTGLPGIATVPVPNPGCGFFQDQLTIILGNGDTTYITENYYDVVVDPCLGDYIFVCGNASPAEEDPVAIVRHVSITTGLPDATTASTVPFTVAVSLVLLPTMLAVGVNNTDDDQAFVWSLTKPDLVSVAPEPNVYNTGYNNPSTSELRLGSQQTNTVIIRVLADPGVPGALWVVANATLTAGVMNPTQAVAVYAFLADTNPDVAWGDGNGIAIWWVPDGGATQLTRSTDAIWAPPGPFAAGLLVCGNAYVSGDSTILYPALPHFSVDSVDPTQVAPWMFVARRCHTVNPSGGPPGSCGVFGPGCGGGCPGTMIQVSFTDLGGCAETRLLNCLGLSQPGCSTIVVCSGDVIQSVLCPGQPAGILDALVTLTASPASCKTKAVGAVNGTVVCNIINGTSGSRSVLLPPCTECGSCCPEAVLRTCGDGVVRVVTSCCEASTTFIVDGPVVVGRCGAANALPIPGSIVFDATTNQFLGYNGTSWQAFLFD